MTAAGTYARLLLELDLPAEDLAKIRALADESLLGEALENPVYDRREKTAVIHRLFPAGTRDFIRLLCDHGDYGLLGEILAHYDALVRQRDGVAKVTFTCCHAPTEEQRQRIEALVRQKYGKQGVEWHTVHDPAILGGFLLTVDDWVLDKSLRTAAADLRRAIMR